MSSREEEILLFFYILKKTLIKRLSYKLFFVVLNYIGKGENMKKIVNDVFIGSYDDLYMYLYSGSVRISRK